MKIFFIAKEGFWFGGIPLIIGVFFLFTNLIVFGTLLLLVGIFILFFFRHPDRMYDVQKGIILAPADGKIINITDEYEKTFFNSVVQKISIFMSIFNVHITYAPINGKVKYVKHSPGKFIKADKIDKDSVEKNENNFVGVNSETGNIAIRQVAGLIARRIVCDVKPDDKLIAGKRMGMVKFGSRIDVYLPKDWIIDIKHGMVVRAGFTTLAHKK